MISPQNLQKVDTFTHRQVTTLPVSYTHLDVYKRQALGYNRPDDIPITLSTVMQNIIDDKTLDASQSIIHHREVVDLLPSNIELSGFEVRPVSYTHLDVYKRQHDI